jgi:hypothetical protein
MNKNLIAIGLLVFLPIFCSAQDFTDALRYSSLRIEGTARSGGMGNAFGALGGDFTAININPAGLGIYRSSEFSVSPNFGSWKTNSTYLGSTASDFDYKMGLSNVSYVGTFNSKRGNAGGLVSFNFGIGYNRLKDFNSLSLIKGNNANASFMDYITENANYDDWSDFYEELAWNTGVLWYDTINNVYWNHIQDAGYGQSQQKSITKRGSLDEYTLAVGLNFNHILYVGASLGIDDLSYTESSNLTEFDKNNDIPYINEYTFSTNLRTFGTGFNFKLGAIYKPVQWIRLGASVATPTIFNLSDRFHTSMVSSVTENVVKSYSANSPVMNYDYELLTPLRATLSAAFVLGKRAIISFDDEYVDYSVSKLRNGGDGEDFVDQNNDISEIYKKVFNFRMGGEFKLTDKIALRGGYEFYPSAFKEKAFNTDQPNAGLNNKILSAGVGYTTGNFFFDAAFRKSVGSEKATLYPAPLSNDYPVPEMAKLDNKSGKVLFTLGLKF